MAQRIGDRPGLARTLLQLGKWASAEVYARQALSLFQEIGDKVAQGFVLARVSLAQGDLAQARRHIAEILTCLQTATLDGTDEPVLAYLTGYRVLRASKIHAPRTS